MPQGIDLNAAFIDGSRGRLFALDTMPSGGAFQAWIVQIPGFGEEMNRGRRIAATIARLAAGHGVATRQIDLFGTGDSEGRLDEATWPDWIDDVRATVRRLKESGERPVMLWGTRLGALVAAEAARDLGTAGLYLFVPVAEGRSFVRQLCRAAGHSETDLVDGAVIDIFGYRVPSAMLREIAERSFDSLLRGLELPVHWIIPNGSAVPGTGFIHAISGLQRFWAVEGHELPSAAQPALDHLFASMVQS